MNKLADRVAKIVNIRSDSFDLFSLYRNALVIGSLDHDVQLCYAAGTGVMTRSVSRSTIELFKTKFNLKQIAVSPPSTLLCSEVTVVDFNKTNRTSGGTQEKDDDEFMFEIAWATLDREVDAEIRSLVKKALKKPSEEKGQVFVVSMINGSLDLSTIGNSFIPLERSNYDPSILDQYDHVVSDMSSDEPCGRIVVIVGPPGTGKTYLIRAMLGELDKASFVLVPSHAISMIGDPSMMTLLLSYKKDDRPFVLIVEDADECLKERDAGNLSSISSMLNVGDGIIGSMIDIRIVCTTNVKMKEVDDAIVRPGRLCQLIDVPPLSAELSNAVYKRLTSIDEAPFSEETILASIYKKAKGFNSSKDFKKKKKSAVGFTRPTWTAVQRNPGDDHD